MVVCIDTTVKRYPHTKIYCTMCLEMLPQFVKNSTNHDNQEACNFGNEIFSASLHGALFVVSGFIRWRREHVSVESSNGASDDNAVRLDNLLKDFKAIQGNHLILR